MTTPSTPAVAPTAAPSTKHVTKVTIGSVLTGIGVTVAALVTGILHHLNGGGLVAALLGGSGLTGASLASLVAHTNLGHKIEVAWADLRKSDPALANDITGAVSNTVSSIETQLNPMVSDIEAKVSGLVESHKTLAGEVSSSVTDVINNALGKVVTATKGSGVEASALISLVRTELDSIVAPAALDKALSNVEAALGLGTPTTSGDSPIASEAPPLSPPPAGSPSVGGVPPVPGGTVGGNG